MNKTSGRWIVILVTVALLGSFLSRASPAPSIVNANVVSEIRFARAGGGIQKPERIYSVTFRNNGCAFLHGEEDVPFIGDFTSRLSPDEFNVLAQAVESHNLYSSAEHPQTKVIVLDAEIVTMSVMRNHKKYEIDSNTFYTTPALEELATIIDGRIFEISWIDNKTGRFIVPDHDSVNAQAYIKMVLKQCRE